MFLFWQDFEGEFSRQWKTVRPVSFVIGHFCYEKWMKHFETLSFLMCIMNLCVIILVVCFFMSCKCVWAGHHI